MIDRAYCRTLARYNAWMNRKIYGLCAGMSDEERKRDRGAFFGSIHGTLNHLVYADLANLSRFTGDPPEVPPLGVDLAGEGERRREPVLADGVGPRREARVEGGQGPAQRHRRRDPTVGREDREDRAGVEPARE